MSDNGQIRIFETGASRDTATKKLDLEGFISPIVLVEYSKYMESNRYLKDGSMRESDNWQKGIPKDAYMKSLVRHLLDLWLDHRNFEELARADKKEALCAIMFNAMGYLFEILKEEYKTE